MAILAAVAVSTCYAQTPPPDFELSALRLGDVEVPPLYYAESSKGPDGKVATVFHPLQIGDGARRGPQKIPLQPPVKLYTGDPQVAGGKGMKSWMEVPVRSAEDRLLLLVYLDSNGQPSHRFLDDSAAIHPAGSVRVVNCLNVPVAFSAGNGKVSVPPGAEAAAVPRRDPQGRFDFAFFPDGSTQALPKRLYFPGEAGRLLVVYSLFPDLLPTDGTLQDGSQEMKRVLEPSARRLFDQAPEK